MKTKIFAMIAAAILMVVIIIAAAQIWTQNKEEEIRKENAIERVYYQPQAYFRNGHQIVYDIDDNEWYDTMPWYKVINAVDFIDYVDNFLLKELHRIPRDEIHENQFYMVLLQEVAEGEIKYTKKDIYVGWNSSLLNAILYDMYGE